jgi:hypothetical protein
MNPPIVRPARAALCCALLCGAAGTFAAGKDRPINRVWKCDNARTVTINFHPRRPREEAWLTYAGRRVEVQRVPTASGIGYADKDGKLKWRETGDAAVFEFPELLPAPINCQLTRPAKPTPTTKK